MFSMSSFCPFDEQFQGNKHSGLVKSFVENAPIQTAFCKLEIRIKEDKLGFLVFVSSFTSSLALLHFWMGESLERRLRDTVPELICQCFCLCPSSE